MAFGTPWCGTSGEHINRCVPIRALVLLRQGQENRVLPLGSMEKLTQIMPLLTQPLSLHMQGDLCDLLDGFLKAVPVVELVCTPDAAAVDALEAYLQKL